MLQSSQPVSNHDEFPYAQVKAVADLYALCWQSGEVVTYTPDPEKATIWLNNYSGTCVQEYVKLERFQGVASDNSPVMPDGWVMVPKEPTKLMRMAIHPLTETACMNCGCKVVAECEDNIFMAWDDMLSAAPQPEVTNGE